MSGQAYPAALVDKQTRTIGKNEAVLAQASIGGIGYEDYVKEYLRWGFSCYSNKIGQIDVEYSVDDATWRRIEIITVAAGVPVDKMYDVTRHWYRATYTDLSGEASAVDLNTIRVSG